MRNTKQDQNEDEQSGFRRMVFYTPTFTPVGGVVKIFDYIAHAQACGIRVEIACNKKLTDDNPVWKIDHFAKILKSVPIHETFDVKLGREDFAFFSWPSHYKNIVNNIPAGFNHSQIIHIVQNVRHANPHWEDGYPTRLLARPMSRIMITDQVEQACRPWLNESCLTQTIIEGHAWNYFHKTRIEEMPQPLTVGYTTWKSDVGIKVEEKLAYDRRFLFKSIREPAAWPQLRNLYHDCDVFLGCPSAEEGFYLVGLEAMAAGSILIMPDAGGNRAYADWGRNCLQVPLDNVAGYINALSQVASMQTAESAAMRGRAYGVLQNHTLKAERVNFAGFLHTVVENLPQLEYA